MVQGLDKVNLIPANHVGYYDDAGAPLIGDGATADDVTLQVALTLAAAGGLVTNKDVKIRSDDFTALAKQFSRGNDGEMDSKETR